MEVDEFIADFLEHTGPYDPQKRREYYLKNRQLIGRSKSEFQESSKSIGSAKGPAPKKKKTAAQRNKETAKNLEALKTRLQALRSILQDLVAEAKKRGIHTDKANDKKKDETKKQDSSNSKEKLSAKQKSDARKRSKDYYDKHKGSPEEQIKQIKDQVKTIQEKIADLRAKMKDSPSNSKSKIARSQ